MQFTSLAQFADWITERGAEALTDGTFRPGKKACQWCPLSAAPSLCAPRSEWMLTELFDIESLDDLDDVVAALPGAFDMTPERLAKVLEHSPALKGWLASAFAEGTSRAYRGDPPPGHKLVLGDEGDRKWGNPKAAEAVLTEALGEAAYERALISFPQAEKKMKPGRKKPGHPEAWAKIAGNYTRTPPRPVLVPESDTRPEHRPTELMVAELDDLDDEF